MINITNKDKVLGMADPQLRYKEMVIKMKQHGLRMTPQRLAILRILSISEGHPTVERVYETLREDYPTISLATVYNTIAMLKREGEVLELGFADSSSRYDGNNPQPHAHLICVKCRRIIDPEIDSVERMADEVAGKYGYNIISQRMDFFGLCPQCQEEGTPQSRKEVQREKS